MILLGSYTSTGDPPGEGLQVATRRDDGPDLRVERTVPGVPDASFIAQAPHAATVYVTNEKTDGAITALSVRDPGQPRVLNTRSTLADSPTHVSVHPTGRYVLTAHFGDGVVTVHAVLSDGSLGATTCRIPPPGAPAEPHAHQALTDPTGDWVLTVDLGADSVYVYRLAAGRLVLHRVVGVPAGFGPRHLTFHPKGRFAYLLAELRPEIIVAEWDASAGGLHPRATVPTVPADRSDRVYPAEIAVSRDGRFVYVSNRGADTIATFAVGQDGGELSPLGNVPTGGAWPRHFALDPTERWFYVANQNSGTVTWLPRNAETGMPGTPAGSAAVPSVAVVCFHRAMSRR